MMIDTFVDLFIGSVLTALFVFMYLAGLLTSTLLIARRKLDYSPEWMILRNKEERDAVKALLNSMREREK